VTHKPTDGQTDRQTEQLFAIALFNDARYKSAKASQNSCEEWNQEIDDDNDGCLDVMWSPGCDGYLDVMVTWMW